ncbi:hypothetical protein MES5069_160058 [Mesorhizobium escarrei]|uniref:Uncharacterized protein n=1 Tax=Mesorhizobium escarrei TaxID=666018 RepID=A0ABM9DKF2_9HYPH|nr:hypothetical protein MES5069_160058 [Mesorhizobium escarrei]
METGAQGSRTKISADAATLSGTILPAGGETEEKPRADHVVAARKTLPLDAVGSQADVTKVIEDALRAGGLMR